MATCTAAPLLNPLVVTTAFSAPSVSPARLVTVRLVAVDALTTPVPAGVKTTVLSPGVVLKLVPVIVSVVAVVRRLAVERVTVGTATPRIWPFAWGLKPASSVPSALSRAILLRGWPSMEVTFPARMVFPSGCTAVSTT